ncbi:MAG: hypothetical protein EOO12_06180 [Chitinophagaceae bacterium]|nr:MAG: hypothetical protein EOO12_06180 [Chitinophagaceae bacterium]
MIDQFATLPEEERELLLQAPALVSVLASCSGDTLNDVCRNDALKLAHLRTFTAPAELQPYYREVEQRFETDFDNAAAQYRPFDSAHRNALQERIMRLREALAHLPAGYAQQLHKSLEGYATHVRRATYSVFQTFIFPIAYSRL